MMRRVHHDKHKRHYFAHTKEVQRQHFIDKVTATILSGSPHKLECLTTMQIELQLKAVIYILSGIIYYEWLGTRNL